MKFVIIGETQANGKRVREPATARTGIRKQELSKLQSENEQLHGQSLQTERQRRKEGTDRHDDDSTRNKSKPQHFLEVKLKRFIKRAQRHSVD